MVERDIANASEGFPHKCLLFRYTRFSSFSSPHKCVSFLWQRGVSVHAFVTTKVESSGPGSNHYVFMISKHILKYPRSWRSFQTVWLARLGWLMFKKLVKVVLDSFAHWRSSFRAKIWSLGMLVGHWRLAAVTTATCRDSFQ